MYLLYNEMCDICFEPHYFREDPFGGYLWYFYGVHHFSCPQEGEGPEDVHCDWGSESDVWDRERNDWVPTYRYTYMYYTPEDGGVHGCLHFEHWRNMKEDHEERIKNMQDRCWLNSHILGFGGKYSLMVNHYALYSFFIYIILLILKQYLPLTIEDGRASIYIFSHTFSLIVGGTLLALLLFLIPFIIYVGCWCFRHRVKKICLGVCLGKPQTNLRFDRIQNTHTDSELSNTQSSLPPPHPGYHLDELARIRAEQETLLDQTQPKLQFDHSQNTHTDPGLSNTQSSLPQPPPAYNLVPLSEISQQQVPNGFKLIRLSELQQPQPPPGYNLVPLAELK